MTERKPPGVSWESWIDQQIHKAREEGAFDNLPGAGKPLPDLDQGYDPDWWAKKLVRREGVSLLPPALEITRKVEAELARIWTLRSEGEVRIRVSALNAAIAKVNATAAEGPSTRLAPLDVERLVQEWRRRAAAPESPPSADSGRNPA
jgi:Domain of unknown function (DUF1992)